METHSVDQDRVGPKLKHTVVSHLGFEPGASLKRIIHSYPVTTRVMLLSDENQSVRMTSQVHECVGNCEF